MLKVNRKFDDETGRCVEALALCPCGNLLDMLYDRDRYDTIECSCGRLYNSSGQSLNPRNMWEEPLEPEDYY